MSKELAQTVGGKRVAWLLALLAAFAVVAALGTQWRKSDAALPTTQLALSQSPASPGSINPGATITYTLNIQTSAPNTVGAVVLTVTLPSGVQTSTSAVTCPPANTGGAGITWTGAGAGSGTLTCTSSGILTAAIPSGNMTVTVAAAASGTVGVASASADDAGPENPIPASPSLGLGTLTINGVTATGATVAAGGNATVSFTIPAGLDVCGEVTASDVGSFVPTASDVVITPPTAATFVSATTDGNNNPNVVTVTVAPAPGFTGSFTVALRTHLATSPVTTDCAANGQAATVNVILPQLRHIADDGSVITQQEVNNNVRGSQHTVCTVDPNTNAGLALPVGITLSNIVVTNGGGYASTADTDPTFTDVQIFVGNGTNGPNGATCIIWRSLDAGDQTISIVYTVGSQQYNVLFSGTQGVVKEWNRLETSTVSASGGASGTATGANVNLPLTVPLVLNPLNGQYTGSTVTITDVFNGSHTNSAGQKEGPMPLAGVNWVATLSGCGSASGLGSGTTTLTSTPASGPNTHVVDNQPNVTFDPTGCAPGNTATITITGTEPGALGSGTPNSVTQTVTFSFVAQIPAKHVFLAWAGQRVVLEHNWALNPNSLSSTAESCPTQSGAIGAQYVKGGGPGNFIPGGTVYSIIGSDEALAGLTAPAGGSATVEGFAYPACTSVAVYESEDQGQVDVEAWLAFVGEGGPQGAPASKVAWVIYYMKIERVNLSLVTQVSKPLHNSSSLPDWAPGNPWDASKDDADGTTEWNVSKDILVRGRVSGWFVNSNPSGRPADTSNPLNVLPANRWVMPNDWPLLAGGPDGEEICGPGDPDRATRSCTAEQFRPYYDIMIAPNNVGGFSLASPSGLGYSVATVVAPNNTGVGSATSPVRVASCAYLPAGQVFYFPASLATSRTVVSCASGLLVFTPALSSAPAAGTTLLIASGTPFIGPYSALDIVGLTALGFGTTAPTTLSPYAVRDTAWKDGDVDWWDAPMPPAPVSVALRGTGFIKMVLKDEVYYLGTPNTASQVYPNPYYWTEIPESPFISAVAAGGGYMWDSWGTNGAPRGPYPFWTPVRIGVNSAGIGDPSLNATDVAELGLIRTYYGDSTIARDLVVYTDNHGEFMVAANGDFKTDLSQCATNALAGGKHCKPGDNVGRATITATADYPDFRGKHFPVLSNAVTVDWTWGGYKDVTVHDGETDQFKYIVFHALDRDGFCSVPAGAVSLHPVLSSADALNDFSSLGARYNGDPVENVDFLIDSGEGIIVGQSGGGTINDGRRFATGVTTFSVAANDPAVTGIKEFPLSPLAASGQTDECQAWIKVSNSLLGILNVLAIAKDDEGNIGFDRVIDLSTTTSYTLTFRWSLITWAGANDIPVMDAIKGTGSSGKNPGGNDISASVTAIYGWNAAAQQWLGFFPAGVNVPGANDLTVLKTGEAYWIAITGPSSVTWTIATNIN
ncbi:hypothetical protein O0235_08110 [Tepidiforma flava]|uniref:DUF11 domain-containing protein n=1 Tax=Tepidiforma flava TaxID=3004094 RepID=A0ABY7M560_9CHLR|nr:hypothetical protein [Tepidiforma flava]WBL34758.1 hypothetical protein O0235_08110 [Tepidiforma flava]